MRQTNHAHQLAPETDRAVRHADPLACGERRLMLAVLEDALRTVLSARVGRSCDAWVREELCWFMSEWWSRPRGPRLTASYDGALGGS